LGEIKNVLQKPLGAWVNRNLPISSRFYEPNHIDEPKDDWSVWLSIEEVAPLHLVMDMNWQSLKDSRLLTKQYLERVSDLISGLEGGWLDGEEQEWIKEELGDPPNPSLPIYLVTCCDGNDEKVVYVGKTKNTSRFSGGHAVALKLQNPAYNHFTKKIYRAGIWFHDDDEYIALDWIQPAGLSFDLLDSIESHLIYQLQPELNTSKKGKPCSKWDFYMHIQNFLDGKFLNDTFL